LHYNLAAKTKVVKELSKVLTKEFGKDFSKRNIEQMRQFYLTYTQTHALSTKSENEKPQTLSAEFKLSWSHYLKLMRIDDENERKFYEIESYKNNWSVRELLRQFDSALYTRLVLSRDKEKIKELSEKGLILEKPKDAIKDPYILEFIGLPEQYEYSESELEQELTASLISLNPEDYSTSNIAKLSSNNDRPFVFTAFDSFKSGYVQQSWF